MHKDFYGDVNCRDFKVHRPFPWYHRAAATAESAQAALWQQWRLAQDKRNEMTCQLYSDHYPVSVEFNSVLRHRIRGHSVFSPAAYLSVDDDADDSDPLRNS